MAAPAPRRIRTAVLISGNGSNLQVLLDAATDPHYPAEIVLVISNNPDAFGLGRALRANVHTLVINHRDFPNREAFDAAMNQSLHAAEIELICLAGFMRVLSDDFVKEWQHRLINIHPSLLPKYKGLDTHTRVLAAGDKEHGATVHWVIPELDAGEVILQQSLTIERNETAESLQQRVHTLEHQLYPAALKRVASQLLITP